MTAARLQKAIGGIYECAHDAATWEVCLSSIRRLLGGTSINLLYYDHGLNSGGITIAVRCVRRDTSS